MTVSLNESSAAFTRRLVDFLWDQWSTLGLAGYAQAASTRISDPEAMLLLTTRIGRHDSRLFDEILDWLRANGSWINLQRLRHLLKEYPFADTAVLGAMAECLALKGGSPKWKLLLHHLPEPPMREPEPFFLSSAFFGEPHPVFAKWGFLRGSLEFRRMSQPPRTDQPAAFLFKLRALFGNQARAEVMAWLLTHESGHPAEIARQAGYLGRTVQSVLNELAASGHIHALRIGREKYFTLRHDDWRFLLNWSGEREFPRWTHWAATFQAILQLQDALAQPGLDEKSDRFQAIKLREALELALPALARAGIATQFRTTPNLRGADLVHSLLADLDTLLG